MFIQIQPKESLQFYAEGTFSYAVLDMNGQVVAEGSAADQSSVNTRNIAKGIYSVTIQITDQTIIKKLILQ